MDMKCKKCGFELDNGSQFCSHCGTKREEEEQSIGQQPLTIGKAFFILLAIIGFAYFSIPKTEDKDNEKNNSVPQEVKKEPPPYTLEDAMKELSFYENRLSEYVKMKTMDYPTAMKAAGELKIMYSEIEDVYNKKYYEDDVKTAYLKLKEVMPKAQKNIYPKIRKAWVKENAPELAKNNVRLSCRNSTCNEINMKSSKYLSELVVRDEMDAFSSEFSKLRIRKIWFNNTFGSGTSVTRQDVSDTALE